MFKTFFLIFRQFQSTFLLCSFQGCQEQYCKVLLELYLFPGSVQNPLQEGRFRLMQGLLSLGSVLPFPD